MESIASNPKHQQFKSTKPELEILDKKPTHNNENFNNSHPTDINEHLSDTHPLKTGTVIEQNEFLHLEQEDNVGEIFYKEVPFYQEVQRSIKLIAHNTQHWTCTENLIS